MSNLAHVSANDSHGLGSKNSRRDQDQVCHQISGMTPSIITTINNTSPTLPPGHHGNNNNQSLRPKRMTEPYESYIEDSFVGHWENEDDDYDYDHRDGRGTAMAREANCCDEDDELALKHPSTIEFDFDSFGPESFIYAPVADEVLNSASALSTGATTSESLGKVKSGLNPIPEKPAELIADDNNHRQSDLQETVSEAKVDRIDPVQSNRRQETPIPSPVPSSHATSPHYPASAYNMNSPDNLVDLSLVDLKVIEPYKKVISHAGYCHSIDPTMPAPRPGEPKPAVIVFSACYLPDRSRRDYNYVMDHLFLYVLASLHELIADDYILIYLHNTQPSQNSVCNPSTSTGDAIQPNNLPSFTWIKRCYQMIDRKLRKNLKILYLVKPTFWLKTIVIMSRPFISGKFSKKLRFIEGMTELRKCMPVDQLILPASADSL